MHYGVMASKMRSMRMLNWKCTACIARILAIMLDDENICINYADDYCYGMQNYYYYYSSK